MIAWAHDHWRIENEYFDNQHHLRLLKDGRLRWSFPAQFIWFHPDGTSTSKWKKR